MKHKHDRQMILTSMNVISKFVILSWYNNTLLYYVQCRERIVIVKKSIFSCQWKYHFWAALSPKQFSSLHSRTFCRPNNCPRTTGPICSNLQQQKSGTLHHDKMEKSDFAKFQKSTHIFAKHFFLCKCLFVKARL